ncbi:FMN-binding domain-containing protein [Paenibacillus helianthi]|uniref:FMN-binding domain-containing protein n=1 Tax=Paenibacillus helianthi TaxID=1349432 RepID=A0ABX3EUQ3_9BACL|nr:FMN-binding protein [Paenibacillus helianthi]OKP91572.1 FMN-binding domain-containing protein [Paenibacillus helianthi]
MKKLCLKIVMGIFVLLIIGGALLWNMLSKEHREARSLSLDSHYFKHLQDGIYTGKYEGGMYKWRANSVQITISSGKVTAIELLQNKENKPLEFTNTLYGKVIASQSLQVDTLSGATLTSKAYLKSVESALSKAQIPE